MTTLVRNEQFLLIFLFKITPILFLTLRTQAAHVVCSFHKSHTTVLLRFRSVISKMDLFLFHHDQYKYFYNCSMYTTEEWNSFGVKRINLGLYCVITGVVIMLIYIPCAKTMLKPELWRLPCYKLMFLNAIIDIWGVFNTCFLLAYLSIEGVVYCSYPTFLYLYGTLIMALWGAQCCTVLILAFNRCVEFCQMPTLTRMFEGKNICFWYAIPIMWFFVLGMYITPCQFNSVVNMWMMDPYVGISGVQADRSLYENVILLNTNNMLTFVGLTTCYLFLILSIWYKSRNLHSVALGRVQRQVSIQACLICSIIYLTGGLYVFFEFFPEYVKPIYLTIDFFLFQWGFCGVPVIYICMNRTLRFGVIEFYMGLGGYDRRSEGTTNMFTSQDPPKSGSVLPSQNM
ncbi:hypothetical protein L596_019437 [Steinernema carpocapsae]|uniref:G-protein coupled receptors family 1 profile domain-containing protein n=1 Tax=Steinernema carpocapsae TaxID=34508 RepID=A0A4V6A0K3_STECR|nr:hypothetical protein L596_019437 [Steinernema carpocapsae]